MKYTVNYNNPISKVIEEINSKPKSDEPVLISIENGYYKIGDIDLPDGAVVDFNYSHIEAVGDSYLFRLNNNKVLNCYVKKSKEGLTIFESITGMSRLDDVKIESGDIAVKSNKDTLLQIFNCDVEGVDKAIVGNGGVIQCTESSVGYSNVGIELDNTTWFGGSIVVMFNGVVVHLNQIDVNSYVIVDPMFIDMNKTKIVNKDNVNIRIASTL